MGESSALATLYRQVRTLELVARKNAGSELRGDYATAIKGGGLLFHEARRYVPGDPVRSIDWNMTARTGEPYVRVHLEERQRQVMVAVDVSPSMHTGFQRRTKLETAVELAATLAVSAVHSGDRVGYVFFADRVLDRGRPRGGRRHLQRLLAALLRHTEPWRRPVEESDPRSAIHAIEELRGGPFVVFLISDFIDRDVPEDLRYLRARHDVSLLHVYDPFEHAAGGDLVFPGISPEAGGGPQPVHGREAETVDGALAELRAACGRHRIAFAPVSTADEVAPALDRLFHDKRRRAGT